MGEGFTGDQRAYADVVTINGVNVSDKCNPKSLCDQRGNSVFVRGFADEIWCNPVFFEETACVLAKTGMTVVSKHLIVGKIGGFHSLFAAQRMTGREDGDDFLLYNRNKLDIWFVGRVGAKYQIIGTFFLAFNIHGCDILIEIEGDILILLK